MNATQTAPFVKSAPLVARATPPPDYMVQLDALRAFAVMAVMFNHFYGKEHGIEVPWGEWGVKLFFVLSGFLITGILLRSRTLADTSRNNRKFQLRQFYARRALRIFPLFYSVVIFAAVIGIRPIRETLFWHLTYASNIFYSLQNGWAGPASHLWSLAVEEQFYLFWPLLILYLPEKYLLPTIVAAIAITPIYKIVGYFLGFNELSLFVLVIACLDSLGLGALLALYRFKRPEHFVQLARATKYNGAGLILVAAALATYLFKSSGYILDVANAFMISLFFAWLIHRVAVGFEGATGALMRAKPLLYLGQISYGLYIFHKFTSVIVPRGLAVLHLHLPEDAALQAALLIAFNILLASCSWYLLERPINRLKSRFRYVES